MDRVGFLAIAHFVKARPWTARAETLPRGLDNPMALVKRDGPVILSRHGAST